MQLRIDTSEVVKFTNTLEKMAKSALPNAVRGALNSAAFDVKQKTMPAEAKTAFTQRSPTFFKANSRVEKASGSNINTMKSTVGFLATNAKNNNHAVTELEQQEEGGSIPKRTFIPIDTARAGGSKNKMVRPNARLKKIQNMVDSNKTEGRSPQARFVKAVLLAGKGGFVIGNKGNETVWRVNSLNKTKDGKFKLSPLYSFKKGRKVAITPTHFMQKASIQSGKKLDEFYIIQAKREFDKLK